MSRPLAAASAWIGVGLWLMTFALWAKSTNCSDSERDHALAGVFLFGGSGLVATAVLLSFRRSGTPVSVGVAAVAAMLTFFGMLGLGFGLEVGECGS